MIVISIIGVLVALLALYLAMTFFNEHCDDKFGHRFFTMPILISLGVAGALFLWGNSWYQSAAADPAGDTLNGIALMGVSVCIYLGVAIYNFLNTNIIYGIFGTAIQFSLLSVIAYFGVMVLVIYLVGSIMLSLGAERVVVVN